jgi:hypothetical protein
VPAIQFEEELAPLGVDEEGRVAFTEFHRIALIPATTRARTIDTTTTQIVIWTNFLFCIW